MPNRSVERARACSHCGASPITGYKFCSPRCGMLARSRASGAQAWTERYPEAAATERICAVCSAPFRRRSKGRDAGLCCSRGCGFELIRRRAAEPDPEKAARARVAEEVAVLRRWAAGHGRGIESTKYRRWGLRARARCVGCGLPVGASRTKIFPAARCLSCADIQKRALRKLAAPARRAMERARLRAARVERVDPIKVFQRDGWRCHLCGRHAPQSLRGSYSPRAPELDHIVPLAAGGEHSYRNTACSCRRCNHAKGAKIIGQPSLLEA